MTILDPCHEVDELGGGHFRHTSSLRPIAFRLAGTLTRIANDFVDGDANFPHVVTQAPLLLYTAPDGMRRICPTRDPQVYFEIGAPFIRPAATWTKVSLNPFTRQAHRLLSVNPNVNVSLWMGGHLCKLEFELKNGFVPPNNLVAFPVGLKGLTRQGSTLLANGVPVMELGKPVVYDAANLIDARPIAFNFQTVAGQPYVIFTLPSLTGMVRPVVDPTLTLQPDASAGKDNSLYGGYPTANDGTGVIAYIGEYDTDSNVLRLLVQFDLTSIPTGSTISAATLSLYATVDASINARTFRAFRMKQAWTELGSTWNTYDGASNWQTSGGFGTNDCEQTDIGSRAFTASETLNEFKDFSLTPGAGGVQDMISGGSLTNNGFMFKADTELDDCYGFSSSDAATGANRPKLVIEYTSPGGGAMLKSGILTSGILKSTIFGAN